jgi:hypothetical protein
MTRYGPLLMILGCVIGSRIIVLAIAGVVSILIRWIGGL